MALNIKLHESNTTKTWWRLGVSIKLTDDELRRLNEGESGLLYAKIQNGDFTMDGESYMPVDGNKGIIDEDIILEY